jgi:hypothetical protein
METCGRKVDQLPRMMFLKLCGNSIAGVEIEKNVVELES